ncbi:MAG: hypothetical protein LBQ79_08410, partial [Deltaproteobacteria bacterium]|nr:hypothetical protein [Deltaproteobacteria bacterium]
PRKPEPKPQGQKPAPRKPEPKPQGQKPAPRKPEPKPQSPKPAPRKPEPEARKSAAKSQLPKARSGSDPKTLNPLPVLEQLRFGGFFKSDLRLVKLVKYNGPEDPLKD